MATPSGYTPIDMDVTPQARPQHPTDEVVPPVPPRPPDAGSMTIKVSSQANDQAPSNGSMPASSPPASPTPSTPDVDSSFE